VTPPNIERPTNVRTPINHPTSQVKSFEGLQMYCCVPANIAQQRAPHQRQNTNQLPDRTRQEVASVTSAGFVRNHHHHHIILLLIIISTSPSSSSHEGQHSQISNVYINDISSPEAGPSIIIITTTQALRNVQQVIKLLLQLRVVGRLTGPCSLSHVKHTCLLARPRVSQPLSSENGTVHRIDNPKALR
jgi:hypothetical protein